MPRYDWETFLSEYCRELRSAGAVDTDDAQWPGFEGASEREIADAESRLGVRLPPSYREFLSVSNGWRFPGPFIDLLLPVGEIDWFRNLHRDWYEVWVEAAKDAGGPLPVSDEDYFVYGEEQDCCKFREHYWIETLTISKRGVSAVYLLNPMVVDSRGEWEAWFFANWYPGAARFRSFWEMMQRERASNSSL